LCVRARVRGYHQCEIVDISLAKIFTAYKVITNSSTSCYW